MIPLLLALASSVAPVAVTADGVVRGATGADGRAMFRGIPFAAPPVGDRRWRAPAPAPRWRDVRDATRSAAACPQADYGWNHDAATHQSEDCLYLDVAAPARARALPVMVWIHGGGNRGGSGAGTIASPIVARGIVLVSIQYRLGALGFLSHPALGASSGNYALMDQQAALRWVRRNIAAFGGDPRNVTIFGGSAGAQDVGLQQLSPGARGLFDKAIEQSGTAGFGVAARSLTENERLGEAIARGAGLTGGQTAAALRALPADALLRAADMVDVPDLDDDSFIWLQPVVDGVVLTEPPAATLARGGGMRVPLLIGSNMRELPLYGGDAGIDRAVDRAFGENAAVVRRLEAVPDARLGDPATRIADDINFRCPAIAAAAAHTPAPTWHYQFDVAGPGNAPVTHGSELRFVLGAGGDRGPLATYWVAFAKTGAPAAAGLPAWPRYTRADRASLVFGEDGPHVERDVRGAICRLRPAP